MVSEYSRYDKPVAPDSDKQGLKFTILNRALWSAPAFAGVCMGYGCQRDFAWVVAGQLEAAGVRLTTVRPIANWETFKAACKMVGVHVEEIPPR